MEFRLEGMNITVEIPKKEIPKNIEEKYPMFFKIEEAVVTGLAIANELTIKETSTEYVSAKEQKPSQLERQDTSSLSWAVNKDRAIIKHGDVTMQASEISIRNSRTTDQLLENLSSESDFPTLAPMSEPTLFSGTTISIEEGRRDTQPLIILFDASGGKISEHHGPFESTRKFSQPKRH